jgi:hypothetical protein
VRFTMQDPTDEFEFKPLSEGLGFHKRNKSQAIVPQINIEQVMPDFDNSLHTPLARRNDQQVSREKTQAKEIIKTLNQTETKKTTTATQPKWKLEKSVWQLSSSLVDTMLVTALFLTFVMSAIYATNMDLIGLVLKTFDQNLLASLLVMLAAISWIYLVSTRWAFGFTPGEWVFDQRLSENKTLLLTELNHTRGSYLVSVALRSFLAIATGFVILPFLSKVLNRDLLGTLTAVQLKKVVYSQG